MNRKKSIFCFTDCDLDGMISYLVMKWAHPGYKISCKNISVSDIRSEVTQWLLKNNFEDYGKVFFLDLDVSGLKDLIDHENVIIIDHHKSHVENMKYEKAIPFVKEYSSACLLAYKIFRKLYNTEFTKEQKTLILYGNDYDSYTHEFPESKKLNVVFWATQKNFETLTTMYQNGFVPFTSQQDALYKIYTNEVSQILNNLEIYKGVHADVDGEYRVVVSTKASKHINDVSDYLLSKYDADVAIVVNPTTNHVSFRRPKKGTMKLNVFAEDIAAGGGHEYAAGGTITQNFLEFCKTLKAI